MRRRYKLLLIIFISFLLVLIIHFCFRKDSFIYVSLGDNLSFNNSSTYNFIDYLKYYYASSDIEVYEYADEYSPSKDLYNNIVQNNENINYYLKNANIITVSLGSVELNNYKELNEEIIIDYLNNIYILLNKISKLNNNIFLINVYQDEYMLVNKKIKEYCTIQNINYIGIDDIKNNNIYQANLKTYLSYKGHQNIADIIVKHSNKSK